MNRRGFTLIELLMAMMLLAMAMGLAFGVFTVGSHYFRLGLLRQTLQNDGRRALVLMERDLRQSCLDGISTAIIRDSPTKPRHALCLPGLNDWDFKGNFDWDSGNPIYNRFMLYYANLSEPGKLFRVELQPAGAMVPKKPWTAFPSNVAFAGPPWNPGPPFGLGGVIAPLEIQTLSDSVVGFAVSQSAYGSVEISLKLQGEAHAPGQKARDEIIQLNLYAPVYMKL